jgi:sarcosine oxidase
VSGTFDAIVAGVGAMGAATAWHLARRGARVLGLERFSIPHARGSSHGVNRIIRLAYFEHPNYVPLLRRAYELWRDAERAYGQQLLFITGGVDAGPPHGRLVTGSLASCRAHDLRHEVIDASTLQRRHPAFCLPSDFVAVLQPDGGFVACEEAITSFAAMARAHGAELREHEPITRWSSHGDHVTVETAQGAYEAGCLIVATGSWIANHVPRLGSIAVAERQVLGWFEPKERRHFTIGALPISILEVEEGFPYQFPVWGTPGFKIGLYNHRHETGDADTLLREPDDVDERLLRNLVERYFPLAAGPTLRLETCLFTNVPDGHFVIDRLPDASNVIVVSACSGHGFKFAPVIGEVLADLATGRTPGFDLELFRLERFGATQ